jgi:hypothetical protein
MNQPERLAALLRRGQRRQRSIFHREARQRGRAQRPPGFSPIAAAFGVGVADLGDVYGLDKKMAATLFGKSELFAAEAPLTPKKPQRRNASNAGVGRPNAIPLFGN